jgi:SAM-dependent methyltransferase
MTMTEQPGVAGARGSNSRPAFYAGLALVCGSTLMYEVVLTRLLSVVAWYYLAFVSVSMGLFGITAGALFVQFKPAWFGGADLPRRLRQATALYACSLPLALLNMLAVPVELSLSLQTAYSFLLFCSILAVPFFFSGVVVCLALTRSGYPVGPTYAADLLGASAGCFAAVGLLAVLDAPSAVIAIAGLIFGAAACFATAEDGPRVRRRLLVLGLCAFGAAFLNALTPYGIQPIWVKGAIDSRQGILTEIWSPIARVRAYQPTTGQPDMWGASAHTPFVSLETVHLTIDHDAGTGIVRLPQSPVLLEYLRYDVTSLPAEMRPGGEALVIGVGGGRDVLNAAVVNRYRRVVGIEVNGGILRLATGRLGEFSGLGRLPGVTLHHDEGRSFLARSGQTFDLIQASMVDTWAATSAGAMSLSENALYTVEGWQTFYRHLKPGGVVGFSRWNSGEEASQTYRLFALAWAALLSEGVAAPGDHLALVACRGVSTLIMSNRPLSPEDVVNLRARARVREFEVLHLPGRPLEDPALARIAAARSVAELVRLRDEGPYDHSPTFDRSPFFFNAVRLRHLPALASKFRSGGNLRALGFLLLFLGAAATLVTAVVLLPFARALRRSSSRPGPRGPAYFVCVGLAFMLAEMGMMQQLSLLLGHPLYSLVVVLAGLLAASGLGALASSRLVDAARGSARWPAAAAAAAILADTLAVEGLVAGHLQYGFVHRALVALALIAPCGFLMGFCAPVGIARMARLGEQEWLPWMWALNGAASVLATFVAIVLSMETSIPTSVRAGAACYLLAAVALPGRPAPRPVVEG